MKTKHTPGPWLVGSYPELPELPEPQKECWIGHDLYSADQMRAYAQAALNARAGGDGWMPIESAPINGYFLAHSAKGWIGVVKRSDPEHAPGKGWFEDEHTEFINPEWLTHWQPLPTPPAALASQAVGVKS